MEMAIVDLAEAERLLDLLTTICNDAHRDKVHTLRFAIEGGLKIKVNSGMWTAAYGRIADEGGY